MKNRKNKLFDTKALKEQLAFEPDSAERICALCGSAYGKADEEKNGEPIFEKNCGRCMSARVSDVLKSLEQNPLEEECMYFERVLLDEYLRNRPCRVCQTQKRMPGGMWCFDCGIRENMRSLSDEIRKEKPDFAAINRLENAIEYLKKEHHTFLEKCFERKHENITLS